MQQTKLFNYWQDPEYIFLVNKIYHARHWFPKVNNQSSVRQLCQLIVEKELLCVLEDRLIKFLEKKPNDLTYVEALNVLESIDNMTEPLTLDRG